MEGQRNMNMKSESEKSKQVLVLHELYVSKHLTIMDIFPKLHCFTFTKVHMYLTGVADQKILLLEKSYGSV